MPQDTDGIFSAHFSKDNGKDFSFNRESIQPTYQVTQNAVWEAPDLVWVAEFLPASQITRGILLILSATILPTLLYTLAVYWYDRYEKEPVILLMTAFLWGAIPSVILAIGVDLFFNLPPELFSPRALEAIQLGVFSPFIEEALKGVVIVFLARKYQEEFNGVMDGIIYGAITGLGFAMTSNLIGYTTSFLYRGFESLGTLIFVEGFLSGLNHAMYSAILGGGIGYVTTTNRLKYKSFILIATYLTAVFVNGVHSLLRSNILNQPTLGFILNWIGISTIVYVMTSLLYRQRITLEKFLAEELPQKKINILLNSKQRKAYLKAAKSTQGRKAKKRSVKQFELLAELAFAKKEAIKNFESEHERRIKSLKENINELEGETHFIGRKLPLEQE
jgi:RsiW-degrading membrane proteinase PrsW (M82 family)